MVPAGQPGPSLSSGALRFSSPCDYQQTPLIAKVFPHAALKESEDLERPSLQWQNGPVIHQRAALSASYKTECHRCSLGVSQQAKEKETSFCHSLADSFAPQLGGVDTFAKKGMV